MELHASHTYRVSLAIWDHTLCYLPPDTSEHMHPALTPARQAGTRFTYPEGMEGWVDLQVPASSYSMKILVNIVCIL